MVAHAHPERRVPEPWIVLLAWKCRSCGMGCAAAGVILLGLTGGIGMGKSTAAAAFRRLGFPVFDADAAVHRLQARGGRAVRPIGTAFPGTVRDGAVDRDRLRQAVVFDTAALRRLEAIVHPLVRAEERRFVARARREGRRAAVLDIPLLLETGGDRRVDLVVVVSAPAAVQRARVRARRKMTDAQAAAIIARQMPDSQKRRRADVLVRTGLSRHHAQRQIKRLAANLPDHASPAHASLVPASLVPARRKRPR